MRKRVTLTKIRNNRWTAAYITRLREVINQDHTGFSQLIHSLSTTATPPVEAPNYYRHWLEDTHTLVCQAARIGWLHGVNGQAARFTAPPAKRTSKIIVKHAYHSAYSIGHRQHRQLQALSRRAEFPLPSPAGSAKIAAE